MRDKLNASRMKQADYARSIFFVRPEYGTSFETVCSADYWAHVTRLLHPGDRIEVLSEDGGYFAELLVQQVSKITAKVFPLRHVALHSDTPAVEAEDYAIKFRGPRKFSILHKDGAVLEEDIQTKEEAEAKLMVYLKRMAA